MGTYFERYPKWGDYYLKPEKEVIEAGVEDGEVAALGPNLIQIFIAVSLLSLQKLFFCPVFRQKV